MLFTGDALNGRVTTEPPGRHGGRGEAGLYVAASRYHRERCRPDQLKESLGVLLEYRIAALCGAHGEPWTRRPNEALARLLDLDWTPFFAKAEFPMVR